MKKYIFLLLLCLQVSINATGQIQEIIDGLIGTYSLYETTNICGQPPVFSIDNGSLEINSITNSDTLELIFTVELFDSMYVFTDSVMIDLEEDDITLSPIDFNINNSDLFRVEVLSADTLMMERGSICLSCDCAHQYFLSKDPSIDTNEIPEIIEDLIGNYSLYDLTDICGNPALSYIDGGSLEINSIANSDTIVFIFTVEILDSTSVSTDSLVIEQGSSETNIQFNSIGASNPDVFKGEFLSPDSLKIVIGSLCLACHCVNQYFFAKDAVNTSLNDIESTYWNVFPNPATEFVQVKKINRSIAPNTEISLINNLGKTIYQKKDLVDDVSISLSDLPNGIYFIRIKEKELIFTHRLIKIN